MDAGAGLVAAGAKLVAAGAKLVAAGAGKRSLVQEGGRRCRSRSCYCREVITGARR